jgi:hypothetical protein
MILTIQNAAHAKEFLQLSQQELHSFLDTLKSESVATTRELAEIAEEKRFMALRDGIKHLDPRLQREEIMGLRDPGLREVKGMYYFLQATSNPSRLMFIKFLSVVRHGNPLSANTS